MLRKNRNPSSSSPRSQAQPLNSSRGGPPKRQGGRQFLLLFVPFLVIAFFFIRDSTTSSSVGNARAISGSSAGVGIAAVAGSATATAPTKSSSFLRNKVTVVKGDWCSQVRQARADLTPSLHIKYPCETMKPAKSAIVCMLTDGVSDGKASKVVFTATNYLHGAMALGASLMDHIDHDQTHMLLLLREGFELAPDDLIRLSSVGWTIGTAPEFPLQGKYLPRFPRYKTTYTKVTAIGLSEYDCVMLMDADTLAVGDMRDIMSCQVFTEPQHRVAGTLDLYRSSWTFFNTGSLLWRPNSKEMERVFNLTFDDTFMKRYSSDQEFLNYVYPERLNVTLNNQIVAGDNSGAEHGQVVTMPWGYNAQTHVEVQRVKYWEEQRPSVRILHYTEKKGWQCDERHGPPPPLEEMPAKCDRDIPICFCREAHLYWNALDMAHTLANKTLLLK